MTGGAADSGAWPETLAIDAAVLDILTRLEDAGFETWCVGGAIRDGLLGNPQQDVDLATAARPADVQRLFPRTVAVGIAHGTVGVLDAHGTLHEVTTFRRDVQTDGRHAVVEFGTSLDDDLARRDFTINAIAYHPRRHEWRDPFGGFDDLRQGVIRAVGEPAARFREDRLRMLRALRFAARFGLTIDPPTWAAIEAASPATVHLSAERVRDEWTKGIATARSVDALLNLWITSGVARVWLHECIASPGRWPAEPFDTRDPVLITAWYCRESGRVWRRLKGSHAEIRLADAIDRGPAAPASADPRDVRRWMADVGDAAPALRTLARWRHHDASWLAVAARVASSGDPITRGDLAITGDDLVANGIPAGPGIGRILTALLDAVIDDPALNHRDVLLARARTVADG